MALDFLLEQQKVVIFLRDNLLRYDNPKQMSDLFETIKKAKKIFIVLEKFEAWDTTVAALLYRIMSEARQKNIEVDITKMPEELQNLLKLALEVDRQPKLEHGENLGFFERLGSKGVSIWLGMGRVLSFLKLCVNSLLRFCVGRAVMRKLDFEFALEDCGYKAVAIVSLVSFMVGLILAFVGALQLKMFGAQIYIASLVAIGMTRIMGAIMAGIIIAGRTGAAYAATIGTMQVNEEVDALKTMGIPVVDFLVLPRMLSLIITMPLLTMLADIMGMIGGASVAVLMLDISAQQYWIYSIQAFDLTNFLVGIFHGFMYGVIISCAGCYYGINCGRDADSVGVATTKAVVSSIVIMIVATGILTSILEGMGI